MVNFFCNRPIDKGELKRLIAWFLVTNGSVQTTKMVGKLKTLGFHYATHAGISIGLEDLKIPPAKKLLLAYANKEISQTEQRFLRGKISAVERSQTLIDVWNATSEVIKEEIVEYFKQTDLLNPVYMMAFSGARGNLSQVRQLVGMRGLMSDPQGEIIELPIKSNFREGLTVTEYIISCYGARKGLVDTALKTANSGYLTRRLVDVAQAIIIKEIDCGTSEGIRVFDLKKEDQVVFSIEKRLLGRVLLKPLAIKTYTFFNIDTSGNFPMVTFTPKNRAICQTLARHLVKAYPESESPIEIRSPLTCITIKHTCQLCYGWSLAEGKMVGLGEAVGVIAAQSIGEPGTQLTMRTFHTGGVFSTEVSKRIYIPHHGKLFFSLANAKKIHTSYGQKGVFFKEPIAVTIEKLSKEKTTIIVPAYSILFIKPNMQVYWKQVLAEISTLDKLLYSLKTEEGILTRKEIYASHGGQVLLCNSREGLLLPVGVPVIGRAEQVLLRNSKEGILFPVGVPGIIGSLADGTGFKVNPLEQRKNPGSLLFVLQSKNLSASIFLPGSSLRKHLLEKDFIITLKLKEKGLIVHQKKKNSMASQFKRVCTPGIVSVVIDRSSLFDIFSKPSTIERSEFKQTIEKSKQNDRKINLLKQQDVFTQSSSEPLVHSNEKIKPRSRAFVTKELICRKQDQYCFVSRESHQNQYILPAQPFLLRRILLSGFSLLPKIFLPTSGRVDQIRRDTLVVRNTIPYFIPFSSKISVHNEALVSEETPLVTLFYKKAKTEDIVQGLPKVEQLFEARRTTSLRPILNNPPDQLHRYFQNFMKQRYTRPEAVKKSIRKIQHKLVDEVQKVYQSQGVEISDKHIEVIAKIMTSRVLIESAASTGFLYGDLVDLRELETYNIDDIFYEPILLGITKAALLTESFLSAASFQQTTRVLTQASLQTKTDFFKGLKENVIMGRLIPAGTGFCAKTSILSLGIAPIYEKLPEKEKEVEV